ncbi:hypothetical protein AB0C38_11875 [Amycolatopsis sp. NPDC048633]|jgi:hypothetical protein|uniref:hypothetical protein n=1 Tax=Amycolatopsis sp. NPDC048633 TaxID=3157095 RepID=UPI0033E960C7
MAETTDGSTAGGRTALKVVTIVWLAGTGIHLLIWLIMCFATLSLHSPFFIWPLIGGAVIVVPWYLATRNRSSERIARG